MNYVYMLRCGDGSLYTGWTNDLEKRVRTHQAGKGGKYTRSHLPVELVWYAEFPDPREAMRREWQIKRLTRAEKLRLIEGGKGNDAYPEGSDGGAKAGADGRRERDAHPEGNDGRSGTDTL